MVDDTKARYGIDSLEARLDKARAMGGADKIERQHSLGRLSARERIAALLDADSFYELGTLAQSERADARDKTPADGKICGAGEIDGRQVYVSADDVSVLAGSGGRIGYEKEFKTHAYAVKKGCPSIHLGDGGGARIPDIMGATGMMSFTYPVTDTPRDRRSPLIATIMGECYGGPTWKASVADVVIQVKGAIMAVSGPSVVAVATGEKTTPEEMGGWQLHAKTTGLVDLFVDDDQDCLQTVRRVLSYFPANAEELPPAVQTQDSRTRRLENIFDLVPQDPRMVYDMRKLIGALVDQDSLLEFKPLFDGSLITALARLDGQVVGILANNPKVTAGAMGPDACDKASAFICLCDSYHIPLIFLHDTPGFFVSRAAEERRMPQKIMNFIEALHHSTVPRVSVIVRKSFGMAHCNMVGANMGADCLLAWPMAEISFMSPQVAMNVVLGRKLKEAEDPEAMKQMFLHEMDKMNAPWEAAGLNLIDNIIDPRDTRSELIKALKRTRGHSGRQGMSRRLLAAWPRMF